MQTVVIVVVASDIVIIVIIIIVVVVVVGKIILGARCIASLLSWALVAIQMMFPSIVA